jgi:hypothetical protein
MRRPPKARIGMRAGRMAVRGFKPTFEKDTREAGDTREDFRVRRGSGKGPRKLRR